MRERKSRRSATTTTSDSSAMVSQQQTNGNGSRADDSPSNVPKFGSQLVDRKSSTPYSDATQVGIFFTLLLSHKEKTTFDVLVFFFIIISRKVCVSVFFSVECDIISVKTCVCVDFLSLKWKKKREKETNRPRGRVGRTNINFSSFNFF